MLHSEKFKTDRNSNTILSDNVKKGTEGGPYMASPNNTIGNAP